MGCQHSKANFTSFGRADDEAVPALEEAMKNMTPPESLEELKVFGEGLQTGDILLMHCTHTFGKLAQLMTYNVWDHVAMIVRLDDDSDITQKRIALIQAKPQPKSSTLDWPLPGSPGYGNVEVFEAMGGGVFSYPFVEHAIARGKFCKYTCVRRLRDAQGQPLSSDRRAKIEQFVQDMWGRPYEDSGVAGMSELARPIVKGAPNKSKKANKDQEALDRLFCSELIAEAYQRAGLLPEESLNSNDILPAHFAPEQCIDTYLKAETHGYTLSDVEIFKGPTTKLTKVINDRREELRANNDDADPALQEQPLQKTDSEQGLKPQ
ncbi:Orthopoxvirus protein of unknown function (DUF830) [Seminavis robusta]|uniref:Uncharacterized protein n=1 Tax=Seminavis robusta TaxID=568900 RepID=A0A9N8HGV0_9STRA|nr:Orthopoxvirus protein of unknown function (DUF830) [Seminavis robusta]|eukprot:Sro661_g183230.1 Orthopoxvirus protein of unknown function (DUF830) (321) ;mRNA; r:39063-40025